MPRLPNKPRRGKRAGSSVEAERLRDIHSKIRGIRKSQDGHNLTGTTITAIAAEAAIFNTHAPIEETEETHIIPRRSLTRAYLLEHFPQRIETTPIPTKEWDGEKLVPVPDSELPHRVIFRRDTSLLNRTKEFQFAKSFRREGSVAVGLNKRKQISTIPEHGSGDEVLGLESPDNPFPEPDTE